MKTIKVVAAIIKQDGKVFATQRGYGEFAGGWEFPGGKVEPGESAGNALLREIKEELDIDIVINQFVTTVEYDYPYFHLSMDCFLCSVHSGELKLIEHNASKWLGMDEIDSVDWLPADIAVVEKLKEMRKA